MSKNFGRNNLIFNKIALIFLAVLIVFSMVRLGYYAVQGHSRSSILVPIESSYAMSY